MLSLDAGFRQDDRRRRRQLPHWHADWRSGAKHCFGEVISLTWTTLGTLVSARTAWEEHSVLDGSDLCSPLEVDSSIPLHQYMGILGPTGMTAWIGLFEIVCRRQVKPWSKAAGGAVGTVVGQLAKAEGCRVIGLTSTPDKARWLERWATIG